MHAIILAGGKGSRLRPFTFTIPKPLVPIGDIPIIEILIRQLARQGFERITVSVGHLAALIKAFCGTGAKWGVPIEYVEEDVPLGTAGCVALVDNLSHDRVLVLNGDTLTDMDFAAAYRVHSPDSGITICASRRTVDVDFGVLEVDTSGHLTGYREKPQLSYTVSMGAYVLSRWVVEDVIPRGASLDMPDLVLRLLADGRPVRVHDARAYWLDLGRLEDLEAGVATFMANPGRFLPE